MPNLPILSVVFSILFSLTSSVFGGETTSIFETTSLKTGVTQSGDPQTGYELIRHKIYVPKHFTDDDLANVWKAWPREDRDYAASLSASERQQLVFKRYGFIVPNDRQRENDMLGYARDDDGAWAMNCFSCHGGSVAGQTIPGLPNNQLDLQSMVEDFRNYKLKHGVPLRPLDLGSLFIPSSFTRGGTNAVIFGIALGVSRDEHMNRIPPRTFLKMVHHDMDPPAWWQLKKKRSLYIDGFVEKSHRVLLQFMLGRENDGETIRGWGPEFKHVLAYIESIEAPKYPFAIDQQLAARGERIFNNNCARCHGTYGENETYPEITIPIDEIGTDRVRLNALTPEHRGWMKDGWMTHYGQQKVITDPKGYVAPPLDGVWATAPYLHNGSVPTLYHLMFPDERPKLWKVTDYNDYDQKNVGLVIEIADKVPTHISKIEKRAWYDSSIIGKSPQGHDYPEALTEEERWAVVEYLKSI